jgi:hypothetical protein
VNLSSRVVFVHGRGEKPRAAIEHALVAAALRRGIERASEIQSKNAGMMQRIVLGDQILRVAYFAQLFTDVCEPDDEYAAAAAALRARPTETFTRAAYLTERSRWRFESWRDEAFAALGGYVNSVGARRVVAQFAPEMLRYLDEPHTRASVQSIIAQACGLLGKKDAPQVLLIAHSLGSVFAFDALRAGALAQQRITLVTIGSPLGDPSMQELLRALPNGSEARVNVERWFNIAAEDDHVCHSRKIAPIFTCKNGNPIEDIFCENFFVHPTYGPNAHKSYGYLDHPVMGNIVSDFLATP